MKVCNMRNYPISILIAVVFILAIAVTLALEDKFSPPPESVVSAHAEPRTLISCLDVQRELNRRHPKLKLTEDGICGPATMAAWDAEINNQYALSLWTEDAK